MLAIPTDSIKPDVKSSALFGNVNYFALYNPKEGNFRFVPNITSGDGVKTAEFLKMNMVSKVVYSYMGKGPFNTLNESNIEVFFLGALPLALDEIVLALDKDAFTQVTEQNAAQYLDSGTQTGECQCGCN